jgi:hypothetical protein
MTEPSEIRYLFIRRPILAGVIAMVIVLLETRARRTIAIPQYAFGQSRPLPRCNGGRRCVGRRRQSAAAFGDGQPAAQVVERQ